MKLAQLFEAGKSECGHFHAAGSGQINWCTRQGYPEVFFYSDNRVRGPLLTRTLHMNDHHGIIHFLLSSMKMMDDTELNRYFVKSFISICQANGYDYPEFKTIEKSMGLREAVRGNLPKSRYIPCARSLAEFAKLAVANPPPEQIDYHDERWELDGPQDKPNICYINSAGEEDIFLSRYGRVPYAIILQDPTGDRSQHLVLNPRTYVMYYFKDLPHSSIDKESALKRILMDYKSFITTTDDDPNIGLDLMGLGNLVESMIKIGYDWPELKQILKSIREHT